MKSKGKKSPRIIYLNDASLEISNRLLDEHPVDELFRNAAGRAWATEAVNCVFDRIQIRMGKEALRAEEGGLRCSQRAPQSLKEAGRAVAKPLGHWVDARKVVGLILRPVDYSRLGGSRSVTKKARDLKTTSFLDSLSLLRAVELTSTPNCNYTTKETQKSQT